MNLATFKKLFAAASQTVAAKEKLFSELDAATGGDGDHGEAIVKALQVMSEADGSDFAELLANMAEALESKVSGSTSSLYGAWLEGMADASPAKATELDAEALAGIFAAGLEELSFATKAKVGGKTMMDALIPATEALTANASSGEKAMFLAAAEAAEAGAAATAQMKASFGRAKNLGDRSIGSPDAGASSNAAIFRAFADAL